MSGPFSDVTRNVFEDKTVLSEKYQPLSILERDEEIEEYRYALQDILFGSDPENIMVYGKAGLGKTAVTKYMLNSLKDEAEKRSEAPPLYTHEVNCNGKSLYLTLRTLVNDLLPPEASRFPKRGLGTADGFTELYQQLDRKGGTHMFLFDEIDHMDEADTLLYELPRAASNESISESVIGVIGISNNYTFRNNLSAKVKDTLKETEISFSPYTHEELQTILEDRASEAFVDGVCETSAINKAAAYSARDVGNARQAIDMLRVGGEVAERQKDDSVCDDHIDEAREMVKRGRLVNRIRDQTKHAQYILETLAHLEKEGETPVKSRTIQRNYEEIANMWAHSPLSTLKSVQEHLAELDMLGFLNRTERNKGRNGGQYFEYGLNLDPDLVLETRDDLEDSKTE